MASEVNEVIRGTTPTIKYTFTDVDVADITSAYLTIEQADEIIVEKDLSDATAGDGYLSWVLTQSELQSAKLRHTVGYYGGLVCGVTWTVTYSTGSGVTYYTYTYTVSGDATIAVTISSSGTTTTLYFNDGGTWTAATAVYVKTNGSWVQQSDLTNVFVSGTNYTQG